MLRVVRRISLLFGLLVLSGCAAYSLVSAGTIAVGGLQVNTAESWNLAPAMIVPSMRKDAQTWTQDGLLLDRLMIVPGVPDGEGIVTSRRKDAAIPVFRADMLPNEIEELMESSIAKEFGEGGASVATSNLRPQRFGDQRGVMFNVEVAVSDGPDYGGLVGSFVADDRLYLVMYLGAKPHYYDKHLAAAEAVITSARLIAAEAG